MTPTPLTLRQKLTIQIAVQEEFGNLSQDQLLDEICKLRKLRYRVAELTKYASDLGWMLQPESMGR